MTNVHHSTVIINLDDTISHLEAVDAHIGTETESDDGTAEIILVVDKGKKECEELLEHLRPRYPDIHITFVPDSSRRMSHQKIAILLGVKAATSDNIQLIDTRHPRFSPFRQFACRQRHRALQHRNGGIDFEATDSSLNFSKQQFLRREAVEQNINFISSCYEAPKRKYLQRLAMLLKYGLSKCHLYPSR